MPGCARHLVCAVLVAHALTQAACSADPAAHPAFRNGRCEPDEREYEGFCLPNGTDSATTTDGISNAGKGGAEGRPPRDSDGSQPEPGDASASVPATDASPQGPEAGAPADSGMGSVPEQCEPAAEACNDHDDDCDGRSDEHSEPACYDGTIGCSADGGEYQCSGLCRAGVQRCSGGALGACEGQVLPAPSDACTSGGELAADEDCDGMIDEHCACSGESQACYSGAGSTRNVPPCRPGTQACENGVFGACEGQVLPAAETCANPGQDDDCDGEADDVPLVGTLCAQPGNMGLCATGTWQCSGDELACATPSPVVETCDLRDQDCDGFSDEDFDLQTNASHCGTCGLACSGAQRCCGGGCVDVATSNSHCGACGMACGSGRTCCGGACRDLQNDASHCGACGRACGSGETCCGGSCVNTSTHADHCGACGNDCGAGLGCCGGTCFNLDSAQDHCGSCGNGCIPLEGCCRGECRLLSLGC